MTLTPAFATAGLEQLNARVHHDLACLNYPPSNWVVPRSHESGAHVYDVVIIGGGQCGMVAAFALLAGGISNIRVLDRNPEGQEGPWLNYARMETLRSPKTLPGPCYGMGSLTFRAWYEAQFGSEAWEALDKAPRTLWMDYLRWYRQVLALPIDNEVAVEHVKPEGDLLSLELSGRNAPDASLLTRKLIMATGREGTGAPKIPDFVEGLPASAWAHSADDIDFASLADKRVVVIGVGASAVDNAAEALEHGAREVRLLIRRPQMPTINKMMGIGSFGFTHGYSTLSDEWRWRFMHYSFITQTPPPRGSTLRVSRHPNAHFHFNCAIEDMRMEGDEVVITTSQGKRLSCDFVILGTGFEIDPIARTELAGYADRILLWKDRYSPPPELEHEELGNFPYVDRDFAFQEREPGSAPWLKHIHCFNYGATVSMGKVSGDIPGISDGANWLASAIAAQLYRQDIEAHWNTLQNYDSPELQGDEWQATPLP
mgnify:CR=1 FL=1|jgi:cation diffusion facilitator CzcD-associated flavoprotein CzcO